MTNPYVSGKSDRCLAEFEYLITYAKPKTKGKRRVDLVTYKEWFARGVWNIASVRKNDNHPAKFPEEIPKRFILMHTDENDLVLDPFMGSGTTAIASINTKRNFIGFELDKNYYDLLKRNFVEIEEYKYINTLNY
jgi:site-specific DNA-methyltransferase (adenine-specific)